MKKELTAIIAGSIFNWVTNQSTYTFHWFILVHQHLASLNCTLPYCKEPYQTGASAGNCYLF